MQTWLKQPVVFLGHSVALFKATSSVWGLEARGFVLTSLCSLSLEKEEIHLTLLL